MKTDLTTPAKRARLTAQKNPYFMSVAGPRKGVSLGWRPGVWIGKSVTDGRRVEAKIAVADDAGFDGIDYKAAVTAVLDWSALKTAQTGQEHKLTVRAALEAYVAKKGGADRFMQHADDEFCDIKLEKLTAAMIDAWRSRLSRKNGRNGQTLKATSINRIVNTVRAALNDCFKRNHRALPAHLAMEIKLGTENLDVSGDEAARPMSILSDDQVGQVVNAAFEIDEDFGRLVLVAAATGARFSQLNRIKVADLLLDSVMVPGAFKGKKKTARAPQALPLVSRVRELLADAIIGRGADEPLLMRNVRERDGMQWVVVERRAWGRANEIERLWDEACDRCNLPRATVMYALRHSSIVRGLKAGLPIRTVAAMHDTSVTMIEKTYARYIVDASKEMLKRSAFVLTA